VLTQLRLHDTSWCFGKADLLSLFEHLAQPTFQKMDSAILLCPLLVLLTCLTLTSLHHSDFVGPQNLPFAGGMTMKEFLGFKIFSTSAVAGGKNFAYHTSSSWHWRQL